MLPVQMLAYFERAMILPSEGAGPMAWHGGQGMDDGNMYVHILRDTAWCLYTRCASVDLAVHMVEKDELIIATYR
jgi:hypothetical protein